MRLPDGLRFCTTHAELDQMTFGKTHPTLCAFVQIFNFQNRLQSEHHCTTFPCSILNPKNHDQNHVFHERAFPSIISLTASFPNIGSAVASLVVLTTLARVSTRRRRVSKLALWG